MSELILVPIGVALVLLYLAIVFADDDAPGVFALGVVMFGLGALAASLAR